MDTTTKKKWYHVVRGNVFAMGVVSFFTDFATESIIPLLPIFLTSISSSQEALLTIGLMESLSETTSAIMKIVSGRVSDTWQKRKLLVLIGYSISSLVRPTVGFVHLVWLVIFIRVVDRVGKGIRTPPRDALISNSVEKKYRGMAFSFHRACDHGGAIAGPVFAFLLLWLYLKKQIWVDSQAHALSQATLDVFRSIFLFAWIPGALAILTIIFFVKEIVPREDVEAHKFSPQKMQFSNWRSLPTRFYLYVGIVFIFYLGNATDLFIVYLASSRFHFSVVEVLLLWVVMHISKIIFSIPSGSLSDRIGRRPLIIAGWLVYAAIFAAMAFITNTIVFWVLVGAYGLYYGLVEGAERAMVADYCSDQLKGSAFGLFHATSGLASLPASILFGVIYSVYGGTLAFLLAGSLACLAAFLLCFLPSTPAPDETQSLLGQTDSESIQHA